MKNFIETLKNDPVKRKKIFLASGIFVVFTTVILIVLLSFSKKSEDEKKQPQNTENNIEGSHIKGDSIAVNTEKKDVVYQWGEAQQNQENSDAIISDGIANGTTPTRNSNTANDDADINSYMRQRERSLAQAQSGSNSRPVSSRRSYNPNGNFSDWTSVQTETTVRGNRSRNVVSENNNDFDVYESRSKNTKITTSEPTTSSPILTENQSIQSEKEKRRLMLRTGKKDVGNDKSIKINIDGNQFVRQGQNVKLKLMQDAVISNNFFPKYTTLYGVATFGNERVNIRVNTVKIKDQLIPCNLEGYGSDGQQGIAVNINAIQGVTDIARNEIAREIGGLTQTRVGNIISRLFNSNRRNDIRVQLLNNHNLIFVQQ